ncbi:AAA family ATPase [Aeromonas veronii]
MSVTQEGYRNYLLARPMKANTVNSYCAGINHLARHCGLDLWSITDLVQLESLLDSYDLGGELAEEGNYGNGTARNALRQLRDYVVSQLQDVKNVDGTSEYQAFWDSLGAREREWAQWVIDEATQRFPEADQWINRGGPSWVLGIKPKGASKAISQVLRIARDQGKKLWCTVLLKGERYAAITPEPKHGELRYQADTSESVSAWFDSTVEPLIKNENINVNGHSNRPVGAPLVPQKSETNIMNDLVPLNQILFGPPGTGKTYNTINKALAILDPECWSLYDKDESPEARKALKARFDELVKEGRIDFVTFHQSFSYEDFVEGIRAESDGDSGQLTYDVVDGVFKRMCDAVAAKVTRSGSNEAMTLEGRRVWKMSLGNTKGDDAHIFDDCIEEGVIRLGYGGAHDYSKCKSREEVQALLEQSTGKIDNAYDYTVTSVMTLVNRMKIGDLVVVTDGNFKFRAIGEITGDYRSDVHYEGDDSYAQVRPVKWLCQFSPSLPCGELINGRFSQMTLYELKAPTLIPEKLLALVNATASQAGSQSEAGATPSNKRVLIIDEINRGNVSRIFGELITLIEPSKRAGASEALTTTLPYSKRPFSVPDNLYLIGTMNTADRSLAGLDIALRRRFVFEEMPPRAELLDGVVIEDEEHKVDVGRLLHTLNQRIEVLLDRDHCLGHAYFMPLKATAKPTLAQLGYIFQHQILPLLQEYFFEDWQRIAWVLNDHRKSRAEAMFLTPPKLDIKTLFGDIAVGGQRQRWCINEKAFTRIEAYALTIEGDKGAQ